MFNYTDLNITRFILDKILKLLITRLSIISRYKVI